MLLLRAVALSAAAPDLAPSIKTVYLLPMASGLDQFLAIRLTSGSIRKWSPIPRRPMAILTDRIGAAFEQQLDDLYAVKPTKKKTKTARASMDYGKPPIKRFRAARARSSWSIARHAPSSGARM